ncbi:MAG: hypothetical protein JNM65_03165 [Verrucomicrobiaceae bacterium]|nr:hypothetical protein [Verrucomicrobiaceae bacterium]
MKRPARILIGLIALFAMAWVHAFKPVRGFECEHDGRHVFTLQERCHGPHSEACHDDDAQEPPRPHDDLPTNDDTGHHKALIESLTALKADSIQLAGINVTNSMFFDAVALPAISRRRESAPQHIPLHSGGRRWPRILPRCIALQV